MHPPLWILLLACAAAGAQPSPIREPVWTDEFMRSTPAGAVAIERHSGKKVSMLEDGESAQITRDHRCTIVVNHRDIEKARGHGESFIAVQVIRFFDKSHQLYDAVSVYRNGDWYSSPGGGKLSPLNPKSLVGIGVSEFRDLHTQEVAQTSPPHPLATRKVADWHAQALRDESSSYSAERAHIRFWAEDVLALTKIKSLHAPQDAVVMIENRLLKFAFTDDVGIAQAPRIPISCPGSLKSAAIRLYKPFADDPLSTVHIIFR